MTESKELVPLKGLNWKQQQDLAVWASKSKQYKHIRSPAQAMILLQYGRDMGFGPGQSLQAVYEVNGVPALKAGTIMALLKAKKWRDTQLNKYDYRVIERSAKRCELAFYERNDEGVMEFRGPSEFTIEDAKQAGLIRPGGGWAKFPRDMLFARAGTAGVRTYAPDCLGGIVPYCTEEMTDTDAEGTPVLPEKQEDVIDAEFSEAPAELATNEQVEMLFKRIESNGLSISNVLSGLGIVWDGSGEFPFPIEKYEAAVRLVSNI